MIAAIQTDSERDFTDNELQPSASNAGVALALVGCFVAGKSNADEVLVHIYS